jgi:hypothetical protein
MIILSIYKSDISWWFETSHQRRGSHEGIIKSLDSGGPGQGFSLVSQWDATG